MLRGIHLSTLCALLLVLFGCQPGVPEEALRLTPESLADRQVQSRTFDTDDEKEILSAAAAVLQDMGFNIEESDTDVGFILGTKTRDAKDASQIIGYTLLAVFTGTYLPTDQRQKMRASIICRPVGEERQRIGVRVTFQRIVWDTQGNVSKKEGLDDPKIYQEFFDKLSKSVFLEAHQL